MPGAELKSQETDLTEWQSMINKINERKKEIAVAVVGKYVKLHDAYLSIIESLNHAGFHTGPKVEIKWVESDYVDRAKCVRKLGDVNAVIIPGGFGDRESKVKLLHAGMPGE